MAEQEPTAEQLAQIAAENEEDEHSVNYKPPAQKSIQEIQELDKDDESLRKYKEALLGRVAVSADPNVPNVVVTRLTLVCSTAPGPLELDLTGDLESFKKQSFVLKEGVEYRIKISFRVRRRRRGGAGPGWESLAEPCSGCLPAGEPRDRVGHEVHPAHVQEGGQDRQDRLHGGELRAPGGGV
uniref:Rho GDP-dissociation inhibitor 1 n=1 Tax=Sus scrofa TaxID=9823 RepID=A0A8D1Z4U7_PIG